MQLSLNRPLPRLCALVCSVCLVCISSAFSAEKAATQATVDIIIENFSFQPRDVKIRSGTTVRWINKEKRTSHSVLFPAEHSLESDRMFPDESWQRTFTKAGSYLYICGPHPEMKGTIVVAE